jgi:hypothetical protein
MKRGRKSLREQLIVAFGKKDFFPMAVKSTEGVTSIADACQILSANSGITVNPSPLRAMVRDPQNQRRIKRNCSLRTVCNLNRGRPANPEPVSATA